VYAISEISICMYSPLSHQLRKSKQSYLLTLCPKTGLSPQISYLLHSSLSKLISISLSHFITFHPRSCPKSLLIVNFLPNLSLCTTLAKPFQHVVPHHQEKKIRRRRRNSPQILPADFKIISTFAFNFLIYFSSLSASRRGFFGCAYTLVNTHSNT
jgi:hypothetical protein